MIDDLDLGFDEPERGRRAGTGAARPQAQGRVRRRPGQDVPGPADGPGPAGRHRRRRVLRLRPDPELLRHPRLRRRRHRRGRPSRSRTARCSPTWPTPSYAAGCGEEPKAFIEAAEANSAQQEHPARHLQAAQADERRERGDRAARPEEPDRQRGHHPRGPAPASDDLQAARREDRDPGQGLQGRREGPGRARRAGLVVQARRRQEGVKPSIEGFLFPDTYEIPPKATAESILK